AVYSGLYASRNIPVSSLLLALVIGPLLSRAIEGLASKRGAWAGLRRLCAGLTAFSTRMTSIEAGLRWHLWPVAAIVLTCGIAASGGRLGSKTLMQAHFDGKRFPVNAVDYLETDKEKTAVLAPDYWGGYLVYRLHPQILVAVDDRHDLYGEEILKSYLKLMRAEPGWDNFLKDHEIRRILVPNGSPLDNLLREDEAWKIVYADQRASLFEAQ
ncbi:MAG: hypothetical protein WB562_15320, partial [Candidatus Sulfotelmatobacter sp.]